MEPRVLLHDVTGNGDPIVLVPGGLRGWLSWLPFVAPLAETHRVVRVQPIHNELGSAGELPDPTYDDVTEREALRLTLDELGIDRADFVGWSGGARALIEFGLEYADRVRTLTLIEPPAYWAGRAAGLAADEDGEAFIQRIGGTQLTEDDLAEFARLAGFVLPGEDPRQSPQWDAWWPHRQAIAAQYLLGHKERTLQEVAAFERPVLLVKGSQSTGWDRAIVDLLGAHFPQVRVLELPGTHACHLENQDTFLTELRAHVSAQRQRAVRRG